MVYVMAGDARPSIKLVMTSSFRGDASHQWSNRYHFNGGTPADATHWETLRSNVVNAFKATVTSGVHVVAAYGYAAGSDVPVVSWSGSVAGTGVFSSSQSVMDEVCALLRWSTTARTSKNHPVYLFNYIHAANANSSNAALLASAQKTAFETYCDAWIAGFSDGTNTLVRAGPNGATATGRVVDQYLRIHSFPL